MRSSAIYKWSLFPALYLYSGEGVCLKKENKKGAAKGGRVPRLKNPPKEDGGVWRFAISKSTVANIMEF